MKKKDRELPPEALTLKYLREGEGVSRSDHAALLGHKNDGLLGKYERGDKPLSRDSLVSMVEPIGQSEEAVDALLALYPIIRHVPPDQNPSPVALNREELSRIDRTCLAGAAAMVQALRGELIRWRRRRKTEARRREARDLVPELLKRSDRERRLLVETYPRYRTWAMAEKVCEESARVANHRADVALELSRFALFLAERVGEDASFRSRLKGFCHGFVGNALRVGNDFEGADAEFVRSWKLWSAGAESDPDLLPEWRLLSLEASLRRAQHRFPEALERLEEARKRSGGDMLAAARILLKKEHILQQMGDLEGALAVLEEAKPLVRTLEDPHLLFALHFNETDNLCRLERYEEAIPLLEKVRAIAVQQGDDLSLTRVVWLEAKSQAGLGKREKAINRLEQVCNDFFSRRLPYDAALASLDLALLLLEAWRVAEVRQLAFSLAWIFNSKKIRREALAALSLFCEAARKETATVDLTKRVIAEIERVRRSAPPRDTERMPGKHL